MSRYNNSDCKVFVGDLGSSTSQEDLEDAFKHYGPLRNVWVAKNPPGFAFVEFEHHRDAEDAVKSLDGRSLCGRRARVELSTRRRGGQSYRGGYQRRGRGRPFNPQDRCYECGNRGHYARDCRVHKKGSRRDRSYSRSRSRSHGGGDDRSRSKSRSRSRSRSRSTSDKKANRSRSARSRSRSTSDKKADRSRSVRSRSNEKHSGRRTSTESEGNTPVIGNGNRSN